MVIPDSDGLSHPGKRKRLTGNLTKEVFLLESEVGAINNLTGDMEKSFGIDLMELYAPEPPCRLQWRRSMVSALCSPLTKKTAMI